MIRPYLAFNGNCEEALTLYCKAFDGKILHLERYKDAPPDSDTPTDPALKEKIRHAEIQLTDNGGLGCGDSIGTPPPSASMNLLVHLQSESKARKAFQLLAVNGTVLFDLQPADWAPLAGGVTDIYGFTWLIYTGDTCITYSPL